MKTTDHSKIVTDEFFSSIKSWEKAYTQSTFNYFATREKENFVIKRASLLLNCWPSLTPASHFQSANIRAGRYFLTDLKMTPRQVVESLLRQTLSTPDGALSFSAEQNSSYSLTHIPFHAEATRMGNRISFLILRADQNNFFDREKFDWEVKAAIPPYDNITDLLTEYALNTPNDRQGLIEVFAVNVVYIDPVSKIQNATAVIEPCLPLI